MQREEMLKLLESTGAILKGHFLLTSGRHSDTYVQCAKLFCDAKVSELICKELANTLGHLKLDYVVSPALGGVLFGYELSRHLNVKNLFCERVDGQMQLRRGFEIKKGDNVLVVEDVVTTGGSAKEVVALCKQMGANVVAVASVIDRSNGKVQFDAPFTALLPMEVVSYEAQDCPICPSGTPAIKPGSRS